MAHGTQGEGRQTNFLLVLISHWSKFATMSENSPSLLGVHAEHLLSLDTTSHAGAVRGMPHIWWQELAGYLWEVSLFKVCMEARRGIRSSGLRDASAGSWSCGNSSSSSSSDDLHGHGDHTSLCTQVQVCGSGMIHKLYLLRAS